MNALRQNFVLKFLPENDDEFNHLILRKFMPFLDDIEKEALKAKQKGLNEKHFARNVSKLLSLRRLYSYNDCGDLDLYWNAHSEEFSEWLKWDKLTIDSQVNEIVREMLEKYKKFTEPFNHEWNETDKKLVFTIYNVLKSERKKGHLPDKAHDEDLKLLSGCLLYACGQPKMGSSGYLPEGVLYLVTNDDDFYTCGKQVRSLKALGAGNGTKISGFDVVKPQDFLDQLEKCNSTINNPK